LASPRRFGDASGTVRTKTDDYARKLYSDDHDYRVAERVSEVAGQRGVPNSQIALAWLLQKPEVTAPIIGASQPHHLTDAVASVKLKLSAEEIQSLEELYQPHRILGHS
jgi:aryl-alcohol dehydrogenase (NADP+)